MGVAKYLPRLIALIGFAIVFYIILTNPSKSHEITNDPRFAVGWLLIVIGVVGNAFVSKPRNFQSSSGFKIAALGFAVSACSFIVKGMGVISYVLFFTGFVVAGYGVMLAIRSWRS